jgi:hypothetical protein
LNSIQLSSRSKKRLSGAGAASFIAEGFFAEEFFGKGFLAKSFFADNFAALFTGVFLTANLFAAPFAAAALCVAGLCAFCLSGTGFPARLDFAADGFFSGIYGSMRLPHPCWE